MESSDTLRNKCAACYRQFNKMEHLVEHMRSSYHSVHEPTCGICQKHCRSFESMREHLIGPLPKAECERVFKERGYETTGVRPEFLRDAMPMRQVSRKIQDFLCNGEAIWTIRSRGGRARILVGHGLDHDLKCLDLEYPPILIRDTAKFPPLMKTSKLSNSLKYLTKAYLGYDIQTGIQDPYDDCVATMRLYMRMRSQLHKWEDYPLATDPQNRNNFAQWRQSELERMSPEELLEISRSDYYCWCLDSKESA
ncbi:exonuclease family protein [Actinidia rufa]|uniref:Exonuclease family protein n=1 Tax=Actinidia rufa TaxID=165716 RepID=A0A7J0EL65_9ERIC|nr:exonuclease family protein [Actinidia rufa]